MKYYNAENHAKNLPDFYKQTNDSNNYKILEIERRTNEALREDLRAIDDILSIENAKGKTLDLYGERIGQQRGIATDTQYILMLKAKTMRSLTDGSYNSIVLAVAETFNCKPTDIVVRESDEPCVISELSVPLEIINNAGLSSSQAHQIIESLLPLGMWLEGYLLEGTFCFSDSETEYDETAGFAEKENAAEEDIGGFFGAAGRNLGEDALPIY